IVPRGARVVLRREISDDGTVVELRSARSGRRRLAVLPGDFDFARALRLVARWLGKPVPPTRASPPLFTIQVLASRSQARAAAYARSLDDREVDPLDPFFVQACHPCLIPQARVDDGADGSHRVILGVYDRRVAARRAAVKLQGEGIDAWARRL
ncbi:MAG TPA: SPOR domain-containing protein, partial [Polyangiaceae bacterium]